MDKSGLLEHVKSIARAAGAAIMAFYRQTDLGITHKADDSPLTLADQASNQIICESLKRLLPVFPIISEENRALAYSGRRGFEYAWLVDPLDGTREFIAGNEDFTVNIALLKGNRPELGVVFVPALGEIYWAGRDMGAFGEYEGRVHTLQAANFDFSSPGLRVLCSRSHADARTAAFIERLDAPERISRGSALKFMLLARGDAELYPRMGPTMEWDTAAAQIIVEEAGGWVVDAETKLPLTYNKEELRNPYFIAAGKSVTNPLVW
jgi:3'(2'), 5'-bisphosphate nucleotidase